MNASGRPSKAEPEQLPAFAFRSTVWTGNLNRNIDFYYIATCIPIARQRLGKHVPAGVNARNNRASLARQPVSKDA
jgi:hypothetical protein